MFNLSPEVNYFIHCILLIKTEQKESKEQE